MTKIKTKENTKKHITGSSKTKKNSKSSNTKSITAKTNKNSPTVLTLEILNNAIKKEYPKLKDLENEEIQEKMDSLQTTELYNKQKTNFNYLKNLVAAQIKTFNNLLVNLKSKKIHEFVPPDGNYSDDSCIKGKYSFKKLENVGSGAFGDVYKINHKNKKLAIKVVDLSKGEDEGNFWSKHFNLKNIEKEADITRHLGDLGVGPKIYDVYYCINDGKIKYYYVMEYMNQGDLQNYMQKNKISILPKNHITKIINKLNKMHEAGYLHDDLHMGNILVNEKNGIPEFYISDFGLSNKISQKLKEETDGLYDMLKNGNKWAPTKTNNIRVELITKILLNKYIVDAM
jgi:predicted Ser/Thr protein kinase